MFFVFRKLKVAYLPIPKTASCSILWALAAKIGLLGSQRLVYEMPFPKLSLQEVLTAQLATFTVVRNPYERLVSYYGHISRHGPPNPAVSSRGMELATPGMPFPDFVDMAMARGDSECNYHLRSQVSIAQGFICIDRILRFEHLRRDWSLLRYAFTNLPPLGEPLNQSTHAPWQEYYDQQLRDRVYSRYQRDFEVLGYER